MTDKCLLSQTYLLPLGPKNTTEAIDPKCFIKHVSQTRKPSRLTSPATLPRNYD